MTNNDQQYEVNFFKPLSKHAKANKKLILILAIIWAVAVFGFQITLMILNEPTPEKAYTTFQSVWPQVIEDGNAAPEMKQQFAKSLLSVLGKNIAVKPDHKVQLKDALSYTVYSMQSDSMKQVFMNASTEESVKLAVSSIGLKSEGFDKIMIDLLPYSLIKLKGDSFNSELKENIPGLMELYLIHNQNVFTDTIFLGFPFHYWYTAQFLLILFVLLCLVYALVIDRMNKKHNFVEET